MLGGSSCQMLMEFHHKMSADEWSNLVKVADVSHLSLLGVVRVNAHMLFLCPRFKSFSLQAVSNSRPFKYSPPHVLNSKAWGNKSSLLTSRAIEGQNCQSNWGI